MIRSSTVGALVGGAVLLGDLVRATDGPPDDLMHGEQDGIVDGDDEPVGAYDPPWKGAGDGISDCSTEGD